MKRAIAMALITAMTMMCACGQTTEGTATEETTTETTEEVAEESATDEEKVTLSIYTQYAAEDETVPYDYAVQELAVAYPNVELELIIEAQDDNMTLKTLASTDQLPDIFRSTPDVINAFRETDQIMVLNDVADETGFSDKLFESTKSLAYADDGNMYAFIYGGHDYVLWYYNKAIFEQYGLEVPTTYDELIEVANVLNENGIIPMSLFAKEGWNSIAMYDMVATRYNNSGVLGLDNGTTAITDQEYVDAAASLLKLVEGGVFSEDATTSNYDQAAQRFLTGEAAMFINGSWFAIEADTALGEDVDWMYYPSYDEESYEANEYSFAGGGSTMGFSVNKNGEHAELAAEVASFIAQKYCEAKIMYRSAAQTALDTGKTSVEPLPAMTEKLIEVAPEIKTVTTFAWGLTNATLYDALQVNTQGLLSNQYTTDEFVSDIESALARN